MLKIDFNRLVTDYQSCFEDFFEYVVKDFNISDNYEAVEALKDELFKLFCTALIEVMAKSATDDERIAIENYLNLHPDVNMLDIYLSFAVANPNSQTLLDEALNDLLSSIKVLKNNMLK